VNRFKNQQSKGAFVISLDFELMWGVRDHVSPDNFHHKAILARKAVTEMLLLFKKYDIKATFATVGFLFCENKEELISLLPDIKPEYFNKQKSPYENEYIEKYVGLNESQDPCHFAPSLINEIQNYSTHEIATHTFSHIFNKECLNSVSAFSEDLKIAMKIAKSKNIDIKSIVFPKNQYDEDILRVCLSSGIKIYRGNEQSLFYSHDSLLGLPLLKRSGRLLDTYLNIGNHHTYPNPKSYNEELINIPSSRFLRPITNKSKHLQFLQLNRVKSQMKYAATRNEVFHLWWHPHNFSSDLEANLHMLEQILSYYKVLHDTYGFESSTMSDFSTHK
jgi:peptidoglycan/xylan/chitin deacetylase (PgdA/CDA1 family)